MESLNRKFSKWLERRNLGTQTVTSYTSAIRLYFASGYDWTYEDACRWKEDEIGRVKPATLNLRIHAINSFYSCTFLLRPIPLSF